MHIEDWGFGTYIFLLFFVGCPVPCKVNSSLPGLQPRDAPLVVTTKKFSKHCQWPMGGKISPSAEPLWQAYQLLVNSFNRELLEDFEYVNRRCVGNREKQTRHSRPAKPTALVQARLEDGLDRDFSSWEEEGRMDWRNVYRHRTTRTGWWTGEGVCGKNQYLKCLLGFRPLVPSTGI